MATINDVSLADMIALRDRFKAILKLHKETAILDEEEARLARLAASSAGQAAAGAPEPAAAEVAGVEGFFGVRSASLETPLGVALQETARQLSEEHALRPHQLSRLDKHKVFFCVLRRFLRKFGRQPQQAHNGRTSAADERRRSRPIYLVGGIIWTEHKICKELHDHRDPAWLESTDPVVVAAREFGDNMVPNWRESGMQAARLDKHKVFFCVLRRFLRKFGRQPQRAHSGSTSEADERRRSRPIYFAGGIIWTEHKIFQDLDDHRDPAWLESTDPVVVAAREFGDNMVPNWRESGTQAARLDKHTVLFCVLRRFLRKFGRMPMMAQHNHQSAENVRRRLRPIYLVGGVIWTEHQIYQKLKNARQKNISKEASAFGDRMVPNWRK